MLRGETRKAARVLASGMLSAALLAPLGCGSAEESQLLSAARDWVGRLGGGAAASRGPDDVGQEALRTPVDPRFDERAPESAEPRELVVIEGGEVSEVPDGEDESTGPDVYSYVDGQGGVHLVRGLHRVPAAHRERAKNLSASGGRVINRYESKAVRARPGPSVTARQDYNPNRLDVTLYSAEWCGACRKTRAFLDREGIYFEVRDIDLDPDAKDEVRRILGSVRIPLLDIDGTYVSGFQPKEIRRLLGRG